MTWTWHDDDKENATAARGDETGQQNASRTASQDAGLHDAGRYTPTHANMSLRDYFAAQAIHAPWGEAITPEVYPNGVVTPEAVQALAANCYALADALLIEQAKGKP